jgi:hypothetical protein
LLDRAMQSGRAAKNWAVVINEIAEHHRAGRDDLAADLADQTAAAWRAAPSSEAVVTHCEEPGWELAEALYRAIDATA